MPRRYRLVPRFRGVLFRDIFIFSLVQGNGNMIQILRLCLIHGLKYATRTTHLSFYGPHLRYMPCAFSHMGGLRTWNVRHALRALELNKMPLVGKGRNGYWAKRSELKGRGIVKSLGQQTMRMPQTESTKVENMYEKLHMNSDDYRFTFTF